MWSIFSCACWPSEFSSLENCLFISSTHFFIRLFVLSIEACEYILDVNTLSDKLFMNIFSHTVGCLFVLLMVSFVVQKLLSVMCYHLFIFYCFSCPRKCAQEKVAPAHIQEILTYVFFGVLWFHSLHSGL